MHPSHEAREMQGQAEYWFFRLLEPDCSASEREACRLWRAEDPANEAAWRDVERIWQDSSELMSDPAIAQAVRQAQPRRAATARAPSLTPARSPARPFARARWAVPLAALATAAVVAVVVLGPGRWWWGDDVPAGQRHATVLGEQRTLSLADGSTVVMDTSTVLLERFSKGRRRIDLVQGQADFQVRSDAQRPFVVHAANGTVTAVGTRFQVRTEARTSTVTLLEGVVQVDAGDGRRSATLSPGQRLRFDDGRWQLGSVDLDMARGWAEGHLFARNWRLADLLHDMNRYSAHRLLLADPTLADLPISGTFRVGDQASLVLALEHGWSLRARTAGNGDIVLERASPSKR